MSTTQTARRTLVTDLDVLRALCEERRGMGFAVDVETTGLSWRSDRILGVALTFADGNSFYVVLEHTREEVDIAGRDDPLYSWPSIAYIPRADAMSVFAPFFDQRDVLMVAHNAKFDQHFLVAAGAPIKGQLHDTMLAAQLVDENRSVSLKALAPLVGMNLTEFGSLERYPGFGRHDFLGVPLDAAAQYAMADTEATWKLWGLLRQQMHDEGVWDAYSNVWKPLLPVLRQMESRGIALDMARVQQLRAQFVERAAVAEEAIWREGTAMVISRIVGPDWWDSVPSGYLKPLRDLGDVDPDAEYVEYQDMPLPVLRKPNKNFLPRVPWFNPASPTQIKDLLFNHYGLKLPDDVWLPPNKDGTIGADRQTLTILQRELGDNAPPILQTILDHRKASKLVSTYFDAYVEHADPADHHCLRTTFNQAVTDTGRLSSSSPINLQNQPARGADGALMRSLFVARPGYKLVVADYSMMELRMAAHFSEDAAMLEAFNNGLDLHTLTAAGQRGLTYDELAELLATGDVSAKQWRLVGKNSNFGFLYGMGAKKAQRYLLVETGVKFSVDESQDLITGFDTTYAGITAWKQRTLRRAARDGYVTTLAGRKRRLPDLRNRADPYKRGQAERQAINAIIQGSCADVISGCMPPLQQALRGLGGSLLLQVHDELVAEVPIEHAEDAARAMENFMVGLVNPHLACPLVAEAHIGLNWAEAKT